MATTTNSAEILLSTYKATPGTLITAELIQAIIDCINELYEDVTPPGVGTPPQIFNVYSQNERGVQGQDMTVDVTAESITVEGKGLRHCTLVRLDTIPIPLTQSTVIWVSGHASGIDTLTLTGPLPQASDYSQTTIERVTMGLFAVTNSFGTGVRIVQLGPIES